MSTTAPFTDRATFRAHLATLDPTAFLPDFEAEQFAFPSDRGPVVAGWVLPFFLACAEARSLTNADALAILDAIPEAH